MIFGLWGDDKTCKSTLALTFPKPLTHMEFDIGGFNRAKYRFKADVDAGLITSKPYVMPFQFESLDAVKSTIRPSKKVVGIKELFYRWLADYMAFVQDNVTATIVIDTATLLWEVVCAAYLQEKQELQPEKLRVSLLPIEYREPNIRMRGIIYQAKASNKHLVLTHHSKDEYGMVLNKGELTEQKTGKKERSGWSPLGDGADVIVHTWWNGNIIPGTNPPMKVNKPYCTVDLAEVKTLEGLEFEEPNYEKLANAISMIKGGIT